MNQLSHRVTFDTLPREIWIQVITSCITVDLVVVDSGLLFVDHLLPLTLVSSKWMNEIHNTPSLWTDIVLSDGVEDLDMKIACCLHFSQAALLSIYIDTWERSTKEFAFILGAHCSRIRSIHFGGQDVKDGACYVDKLLGQVEFFPSLTNIIRTRIWPSKADYFDLHTAIQKAPLLRVVEGYAFPFDILKNTRQKWQIIDTKDPLDVVMPFLVQQPSLQELGFLLLQDEVYPDSWITSWNRKADLAPLSLKTLDLPLNTLSFSSLPSTLSQFRLDGSFSTICSAVPFFSQMPQLHRLSIKVAARDPNNSPLIFEPCSASSLHISPRDLYTRECESWDAFWKIFPAVTPWVRQLQIWIDDYPEDFTLPHDHALPHLESLHLQGKDYPLETEDGTSSQEPFYLPPSVLNVTIDQVGFLNRLTSTSIEMLEIYSRLDYSLHDTPHLSEWATLRSLSLLNFRGTFQDISIPNLVTLTLTGAHSKAVTEFCQQLAVSSQNYPSSKHLKTDICPEWDILVIMLERRNFTQNLRVARITQVELPAVCPPSIRSILIELIQGRRVTRPSNLALSLAGNLDELLDKSLTGCVECHQALRYCSEPASTTLGWPEEPTSLMYPEDIDAILQTWKTRDDAWLKIKEGTGRENSCRKYGGKMICIDEYSHEEATLDWVEYR